MAFEGANAGSEKRMRLRYAGVCRLCGAELAAKTEAIYEPGTKTIRCLACEPGAGAAETSPVIAERLPSSGVAGASARREYERRTARNEQRTRDKWGPLGGIAVALSDERQSTKAWKQGAIGEELLGPRLDSWASNDLQVLHDRRIRGTKANIDHIVVAPSGVWVVDAKRYQGRPELRVDGGLLRPRSERLFVGRRDCSKLVDGVLKQVGLVEPVIAGVPVTGVLCFVEADWPVISGAFITRGVHVVWPKRLGKLIGGGEPRIVDVPEVTRVLASTFPSA